MTTSRAWLVLTSSAICVILYYVTLRGTILWFFAQSSFYILNCFFWNINMGKLCGNAKLATEKVYFTAEAKNNKK
jgi:hypothetical protein